MTERMPPCGVTGLSPSAGPVVPAPAGASTPCAARPISEYHEDMGCVLWWFFPITEAPYVGSPLDLGQTVEIALRRHGLPESVRRHQVGGWPGYHTHWTPIIYPEERHAPCGEQAEPSDPKGLSFDRFNAADRLEALSAENARLAARASAAEAKVDRLTEALRPFASGGDWGAWLSWLINGASDRAKGLAAAKQIVKWTVAVDTTLSLKETGHGDSKASTVSRATTSLR